ncbi:MAG: hypothetical protein V7677_19355, partial [Motiliproteus sp.]
MQIKKVVAALAFSAALAAPALAQAVTAPEVTYDRVQEIFGLNLETDESSKKLLLLAVGMDHTSPDSPFANQRIGIPFIVEAGPGYWVSRLKSGERKVEVLVNNALLLMFTDKEIPRKQEVARKLLEVAAESGYWPADFYIADFNLETKLSKDLQKTDYVRLPLRDNEQLRGVAEDTMARLNRCAEIGFAPCKYRIGFWLLGSEQTMPDGINVLKSAITTSIADRRY